MKKWLSLLPCLVFLLSCKTSPYALSDRAAKDMIVRMISEPTDRTLFGIGNLYFPLGDLSVISPMHARVRLGDDKISQRGLAIYQRLTVQRLITMTNYIDLTKGFHGWSAWSALTQQGITQQFHAERTSDAKNLNCPEWLLKTMSTGKALCIEDGKLEDLTVTQNQLLNAGSDYYRVVRGLLTWSWNQQFLRIIQEHEGQFKRERKFAILLKFEPFKKSWVFTTEDSANRDEDFELKNVEKATVGMNPVNN